MNHSLTEVPNDDLIEDTGERMIPTRHLGHLLYGEHIIRYQAVDSIVKDKVVLDIASGSGYGSSLLAKSALQVTGVDISAVAIEYAKANYPSDNVNFLVGSATDIPIKDASCDIVVSFETMEHILEYKVFLSEVKRVLKPNGLLVLSTPNDETFPKTNKFHVHEFQYQELKKDLSAYFSHTREYFQGTWLYSGLMDEEEISSTWTKFVLTSAAAPIKAEQSAYFFMICANRIINEQLNTSYGSFSEYWSARKSYEDAKSLHSIIETQNKIIADKDVVLSENDKNFKIIYEKCKSLDIKCAELKNKYALFESVRESFFKRKDSL